MGSMSMNVMIPTFKEGPKSKKTIKGFTSAIGRFLTSHEEGGEAISFNADSTSSQNKGNDAWKIELRLEELPASIKARNEVETSSGNRPSVVYSRPSAVYSRSSQTAPGPRTRQ